MNEKRLYKAMFALFSEAYDLWAKKQKDYGPSNVAAGGQLGVALRLNDKVQRLLTLLRENATPSYEAIRDSWIDACVYGAMGAALHDGDWPLEEPRGRYCETCGRRYDDGGDDGPS